MVLRCSESAVKRAIRAGVIPAVPVGPRLLRVPAGFIGKSADKGRPDGGDAPTAGATGSTRDEQQAAGT